MTGLYVSVPMIAATLALIAFAARRVHQAEKTTTPEPRSNVVELHPTTTTLRLVRDLDTGDIA